MIEGLVSAFPASVIDRALIEEPSALWEAYDEYSDLTALDGKTWRDVGSDWLVRHPTLLLYAGDSLWRAMLPAYLGYLLRERERFNDLPFQIAGELTRSDDPERQPKFDRRVGPLTAAQRDAIREVLSVLATVPPMEEVMSRALHSWKR